MQNFWVAKALMNPYILYCIASWDFKPTSNNRIFSIGLKGVRSVYMYKYSNMPQKLSGKNCKFLKLVLSIKNLRRLEYKENNIIFRSLPWKPRSYVRILIYWYIERWQFSLRNYSLETVAFMLMRLILFTTIGDFIEDITRWREDMNLPREHKIHIFELTCNVLFII